MTYSFRPLWKLLGLAAPLTLAGCGGGGDAPALPKTPNVVLSVPEPNRIGPDFSVTVTVTGCADVKELSIVDTRFDRKVLKTVAYDGPDTNIVFTPAEIPFATHGIAAQLSLTAEVICEDGRSSASNASPARYFPARRVVEAPELPNYFVVEGLGDNASFVGCHKTAQGLTELARFNRDGVVTARNGSLPFDCTESAFFTERHVSTGKRWLVQNDRGAIAFDEALNISATIVDNITHFAVGPDGDAVYHTSQANRINRFSHQQNVGLKHSIEALGIVNGNPVIAGGEVVLPYFFTELGALEGSYSTQRLTYDGWNPIDDSVDGSGTQVLKITWGFADVPPIADVSLNAAGTTLFVPFETNNGLSGIAACNARVPNCAGADRRWQTVGLQGTVVATTTYWGERSVAALGTKFNWFLDPTTGAVQNAQQLGLSPNGGLITYFGQPGRRADFYLLNGSTSGAGPLEVVGTDNPASGELFRYEILSGSLMVQVDDDGAPWMRVGQRLVQLHPLATYRQWRTAAAQ